MNITGQQIQELIQRAQEASNRAYAPYSKFPVGAALLLEDGSVFTGCNVENASYGGTNCAERTAIFKMVSETDEERRVVVAVAIYTPTDTATPPCGFCRQVINEFAPQAIVVSACKDKAMTTRQTLSELLPGAFGPHNLS